MKKQKENKPVGKFWIDKINGNIGRDRKVNKELKRQGWTIIRFWEHQIKSDPKLCIRKIEKEIQG